MTPKEKAQELTKKMYDLDILYEDAKQCAVIAVDEILKEYREDYEEINKDIYTIYSWWQEVKQEIELL